MTTDQKRKILQRIVTIESDIETLKKARLDIAASGYASASLASGGGSRSYTHTDLSKISETIAQLMNELKELRVLLKGGTKALPNQIYTIYI